MGTECRSLRHMVLRRHDPGDGRPRRSWRRHRRRRRAGVAGGGCAGDGDGGAGGLAAVPIWPGGAKGRQPAPGASWSPRRPASCKCKLRRSTVSAAIARRFRMYGGRPRLALEEVQKLVMGNAELVGALSLRSTRVPSQFRESQEDDGRQPSITIGQLALRGVISNMRTKDL